MNMLIAIPCSVSSPKGRPKGTIPFDITLSAATCWEYYLWQSPQIWMVPSGDAPHQSILGCLLALPCRAQEWRGLDTHPSWLTSAVTHRVVVEREAPWMGIWRWVVVKVSHPCSSSAGLECAPVRVLHGPHNQCFWSFHWAECSTVQLKA